LSNAGVFGGQPQTTRAEAIQMTVADRASRARSGWQQAPRYGGDRRQGSTRSDGRGLLRLVAEGCGAVMIVEA
jgi:hypothetical protein